MTLQDHAQELIAARARADRARAETLRAGEALSGIEARLKALERRFDARSASDKSLKGELEKRLEEAGTRLRDSRAQLEQAQLLLVDLHARIAPFVDPRTGIDEISSELPILLLPLRLETRFSTFEQAGVAQPCLLVRAYPDDALIDTFEETPSATELSSAQRFWCGWWKSQGAEPMRRTYWRELTARLGIGRAQFAALGHRPLATSDAEPTTSIADVLLVVPCIVPLTGPEKSATSRYVEAVWRAEGDAAKIRAAVEALSVATNPARASELAAAYVAFNSEEATPPGRSRAEPALVVRVLHLVFTDASTLPVRNTAWASQPRVNLLPERLVLVAELDSERPELDPDRPELDSGRVELVGAPLVTPLAVGPDPRAPREQQYQPTDAGDLFVPEEQRWMTDFEAALASGMAFRLMLTPQQAERGFERVYVLGVRLTSDAAASKAAIETLIAHHAQSSAGFSLIPQGTPTNRTEADGEDSVWRGDDGFDAFERTAMGIAAFDPGESDAWERSDGALLAEALGIDAQVLQPIRGADLRDMGEAHAMNAALWPATLGYWMDTMMNTVFGDETIGRTRVFFEEHVSGRGSLPAVRIGKQPYGVLPTTAFSRLAFTPPSVADTDGFVKALYPKLEQLRDLFWKSRGDDAAHVGMTTSDPQQLLLDILGLHPASVEFHQQWAQGLAEFWNRLSLDPGFDAATWNGASSAWLAPALLAELGHTGPSPDLLDKIFTAQPILLNGPVIDDRPSSESELVRIWTTDGKNYLAWLAEKAASSLDALRKEEGFIDDTPPAALLYLVLKHALELGLYDAALKLHAAVTEPSAFVELRREKNFIHVEGKPASESRYAALYATNPRITGDPELSIADYIVEVLDRAPETQDLERQIAAVEFLKDLPTARLERLFAEHVDLCTARLDAWLLAVVHERLKAMRGRRATGIAIGAYGYVENLRPKSRASTRTLAPADAQRFGASSVQIDSENGGFIHALSPDHATTAAILRNGHMRNAVPAKPDLFAVDLSSERVRVALGLIEGLRSGQSLGALLGYRFERGLHDRGGITELDRFMLPIRLAFPLQANRMAETAVQDGSIDTIEARNVVDGVKLIEHVSSSAIKTYPWGKDLEAASPAERALIDAEVAKLAEANDALADLALAESVHQMARGNVDRAAAAMDMFEKGGFPVQPDVVRTPRGGLALTHRMALHLDPAAGPGTTPRSQAEPALNAWLRGVLPPLGDLVSRVGRREPDGTLVPVATVSWSDLGLDAIDIVHMLDVHDEQGMNAIDDRIVHRVLQQPGITPDTDLVVMYVDPVAGKITLFEAAPMVESLRELVLGVKPWSPEEAMLPNETKSEADGGSVDETKVQNAWNAMKSARDRAAALKAAIDVVLSDPASFPALRAAIDAELDEFVEVQKQVGVMGVALSSFGGMLEARRAWSKAIRSKAKEHAQRWTEKLASCDAMLAAAAAPGLDDSKRVELLKQAEAAISTVFVRTGSMQPPLTPAPFRLHVEGLRTAFIAVQAELNAVANNAEVALAALSNRWETVIAHMAVHDPTSLEPARDRTPLVALLQDVSRQLGGLVPDLDGRLKRSQELSTLADAALGRERCDERVHAMKVLFGDDFVMIPRYTIAAAQRAEWVNAWNGRTAKLASAAAQGIDHPVDEWLYGVARVRPKAAAWESLWMLCDAFETATQELEPVQFPHIPAEPWLALQWPAEFDAQAATDHLLYTACYATGAFDAGAALHCGLLLDEWTEVVPASTEATSIAFHYDRPSNEAPQTWLLATPAFDGPHWTWEDLRATIPDTMALARLRAVEPRAFDDSAIARFLPATIAAVTARRVTIGVDLAINVESNAILSDA